MRGRRGPLLCRGRDVPEGFRLRGDGFEGLGIWRRLHLAARGLKGVVRRFGGEGELRLIGTCLPMGERRRLGWSGLNRGLAP